MGLTPKVFHLKLFLDIVPTLHTGAPKIWISQSGFCRRKNPTVLPSNSHEKGYLTPKAISDCQQWKIWKTLGFHPFNNVLIWRQTWVARALRSLSPGRIMVARSVNLSSSPSLEFLRSQESARDYERSFKVANSPVSLEQSIIHSPSLRCRLPCSLLSMTFDIVPQFGTKVEICRAKISSVM